MRQCGPACSISSCVQMPWMMSRISSSRSPRRLNSALTAVYSSRSQPMPNPASSRPPLTRSSEVRLRASNRGGYQGALRVLVPSLARVVAVAATVRTVSGSRNVRYSGGYGFSRVWPG